MQRSSRTNSYTFVRLSVIVLALASYSVLVQARNIRAENTKSVAAGTWGGEHIILEVSQKSAEAEFDCAHGQITQPIALDKHGDFDVAGTFTPEHGGPVQRDEVPASAPARYSGHVEGNTMTLTIVLEKEKLGPFTLTHGNQPLLRKCR